MQVVGTDPFLSVGAALRLNPAVKIVKDSDGVFAAADYLTIHVPFNNDTKGMINAETIAKMKDGVRVLNYARGELANDDDMHWLPVRLLATAPISRTKRPATQKALLQHRIWVHLHRRAKKTVQAWQQKN